MAMDLAMRLAMEKEVTLHLNNVGREARKIAQKLASSELGKWDSARQSPGARRFRSGKRYRSPSAFTHEVKRGAKGPVLYVQNNAPHAAILEYGSRAHPIDPHPPKKLLKFQGRNGDVVLAEHVNHPGQKKGYFILTRAVQQALGTTKARVMIEANSG